MSERIVGYDLARALAVFGMVSVNFKVVMTTPDAGPVLLARAVGLLEGRAAATFVVLAGIGVALLSRQARQSGDPVLLARARSTLLKRALFLFVVGLLYAPIWPADILHFYSMYIAAAAFLLTTSRHRLWGLAWGLVMGFVGLLAVFDYERGWNWTTLEYTDFWTPAGMIRHLFFNGFHPVIPWLAFLLVGLIVGHLNIRDAVTRRRVFVLGAGAALLAETTSRALIHTLSSGLDEIEAEEIGVILGTSPMPPMPLYMIAGAGTACAVIAVAVSTGERFADARCIRMLVSTGQLALTLYVAHVVLGMGALDSLGQLQQRTLLFVIAYAASFCALGVLFAQLWRRRFARGPLEMLMRAAT